MSNRTKRKLGALLTLGTFLIGAVGSLGITRAEAQAQPKGPAPKTAASASAKAKPAKSGAITATAPSAAPAIADGGAAPAPTDTSGVIPAVDGGAFVYTGPTAQKKFPPPPPPTQQQIDALNTLKTESDVYAKGAKDYRDTVTTIIKIHYETKKKEILSGLDDEIGIEKGELKKARETAIKRLEEFIATYSGPRAEPVETPDAMYRLAALYEERARAEDATDPIDVGLKPAIALYKRVINEYPKYHELAGIYYFLGHAYNDSNRTDEAMQVWRSLVCHNHYPYPTAPDPKNPDHDSITPMPQDNDEAHWTAWRAKYRDYKRIHKGNPETTYQDPYPADCQGIAQPEVLQGDEPKYVAEIWWQLGNWEFDQLDLASGVTKDDPGSVWGYNRSASAYTWSMKFKRPPIFGVALYKYSWALFKQQRYEAATKEFVHLLLYTDDQQKETGDPGADFRGEAYTYIAGSLTNLDFAGPAPEDPFIQRPDIIDTEPRPDVAEKKLHVAVDRVQDPNIIPQDKPWTIEIYKALAGEFRSLNQFSNAIEVYQLVLKKWPMDPTAPDVQEAIAETYEQLNLTKKVGTAEHDAIAAKVLEARTALANYIGNTPWVDANKDNPAALQNAERLVRGGLRQAAAQHTNNGKAALQAANDTQDAARQLELLGRAESEYKLAALGWSGYLKQDENAPDSYESRYWLADARHQSVRIEVVLHKLASTKFAEPTPQDISDAMASAVDVRDSNEDDQYLDNAAFFVVDVSDVDRDIAYQNYIDTRGSAGVPERTEVKFDNDGPDKNVVADPVPPVVIQGVQARDDYVARVPPNLDVNHNAVAYQYYAADVFFLYGQFDQAKARLEPMWQEHCGKDEYGYKAWERLITMSNLQRDATRSTQLAEAEKAHSCAFTAAQSAAAGTIVNPTLQEAAYVNARKKFEEACGAPVGQTCKNPDAPEKKPIWLQAAGLYEAALQASPARDEAPEAAMNAAYAYKQVGEYQKAIDLYNKFITEYGSDALLTKLQKGDPKAKVAPDPKKYSQRLQFLSNAYDALGETYYGFFNYTKAAETYEKVSANDRFDDTKRKTAAQNAMTIYAAMGDRDKMNAQYKILKGLAPNAEEKANADYLVADFDHRQWNPNGADTGSNKQSRFGAISSLETYYNANRSQPGAAKYLVAAAHDTAVMMKVGGDTTYHTWYRNTITAWENYKAHATPDKDGKNPAMGPPYADYAAEADYTLVDEQIKANYDLDSRHKYTGTVPDILGTYDTSGKLTKPGKYQANAKEADKWDKELDRIAKTYPSVEWVPAAFARRGSLYDELRTGLYNVTAPPVKLFTPAQQAVLTQMANSGRDDLMDKADALQTTAKEQFRAKKDQELGGADEVMVRNYATAVALSRKYNVKNIAVTRAVGRLAYFTDIIGDAKLHDYVTRTPDPVNPSSHLDYKDGQYVQTRPGVTATQPPSGASTPLPEAP